MEVISWKNMPIITATILLLIRQQFHMDKGIINAFNPKEMCLVIYLTKGGNWAITMSPVFATGYVSFATAIYTR